MKKLTEILALLLCFVIAVGCFVSCDENKQTPDDANNSVNTDKDNKNPDEDKKQEDEPLPLDKYTIKSSIRFATNDYKMKDAVASMNSSVIIDVDKENVCVNLVSVNEDISVNKTYVLYDGVLYHSIEAVVGEYSVVEYEKAAMGNEDKDSLLKNVGAGASIGFGDFKTHNMTVSGGHTIYTCTDITEDSRLSLSRLFASNFEGSETTVEVKKATYILEAKGEYNYNSTLSCNFVIDMEGSVYEITMHVTNEYTYSNDISVSLPQNSDEYVEKLYGDIIG